MAETAPCPYCTIVRLILVCLVGGALCGFGAIALGLSSNASMIATFSGAFLPLFWYFKRKKNHD